LHASWLSGGLYFGFLYFPAYRLWVVAVALVICVIVWIAIARTRLGSILRASSENAAAAEALGVGVPRVFAATFALGAALAGLAGALEVAGPFDPVLRNAHGASLHRAVVRAGDAKSDGHGRRRDPESLSNERRRRGFATHRPPAVSCASPWSTFAVSR